MMLRARTRTTNEQQPAGELRPAGRTSSFVIRSFGLLLSLSLCFLFSPSDLLAQCATCRSGGHCAQSEGGKCFANRTFWGYYQSNWRKWPSVAAAEQAAAYEAEHTRSPASAAPSSVVPKPEDEARDGNTSSRSTGDSETAADTAETEDSPNDNIAAPRRTNPDEPEDTQPDPFERPKQLLPEPSKVQPKPPGANLDDPAPVLPVDPNDSVPSLPPNLRDMKPPAEESLDLENLFKTPGTPAPKPTGVEPKPAGGAALPRSNTSGEAAQARVKGSSSPAEATMTPAERTADFIKRRREHTARNQQYLKEKYANAVKKPAARVSTAPQAANQNAANQVTPANATQAAAANTPSTAASLDELTTMNRPEASAAEINPRTLPKEAASPEAASPVPATDEPSSDASAADNSEESKAVPNEQHDEQQPAAAPEESTLDAPPSLDIDEPNLLLSPTDTASKNPLRENMEHARYAARMFTPQVRTAGEGSAAPVSAGPRGTINPLRSGTPLSAIPQANKLREVIAVTYEEELPAAASADHSDEAKAPLPLPAADVKLSPIPMDDALPMPAATESVLQTSSREPVREDSARQDTWQRKPAFEPPSAGNVLRDEPPHLSPRANGNPLRGTAGGATSGTFEERGVSLPAKTPGTGRYMTNLANPTPAGAQPSRPAEPAAASPPRLLGTANPLRSGL